MKRIAMFIALLQAVFALRVIARLVTTAGGSQIDRRSEIEDGKGVVTVLVPVLNEAARLPACLAGVTAQGPDVAEILIIDGGSTDDTQAVATSFAARDDRIRLIDATPVPADVNGKAYGLQVGVNAAAPRTDWLLTIDADVRPDPMLVQSLLEHAGQEGIGLLSVATRQRLSGSAEGILHPAMLATLVYRFGIPGHATADLDRVQANGQCFLVKREVLTRAGGFTGVFDSACEDVTLARIVAANGDRVGFYEAGDLVSVEMYAGWRDAWQNWSRSLPVRDRFTGRSWAVGLSEVTLVQALPLYLAPSFRVILGRRHPATVLNLALLCVRAGVLAGMARAYERRPLTYWLSPLADLPVALRIWQMSRRRRHRWRGRTFVTGAST